MSGNISVDDTIFALSSAAGRAGIAVVRVSGPAAGPALAALTGRTLPAPRRASLARLRDPAGGAAIDRALTLWFPGPASATGEDLAEFHLHGGPAVVAAALAALSSVPGCRLAEAGEFTRRAFDHGKLDLAEVEGLADLIAAETEAQRKQALRQMEGALSALIEDWRERLIAASARLEALIDFPDEDLPEELAAEAAAAIGSLASEIAGYLDDARAGERLRHGVTIAIVGAANAGKSSLLNALARRDVAIVTETAGTTRDVIEVHLDLAGYPVTLADTAGLRALADDALPERQRAIEAEGMRRAKAQAEAADIVLALFDLTAWPALDPETLALMHARAKGVDIVLLNKADLSANPAEILAQAKGQPELKDRSVLAASMTTGTGLEALLEHLTERVAESLSGAATAPLVTRLRHRQALEDCREALVRAEAADLPELAAEDLRLALRALGRIVGRIDVEDILDSLFRDFCIGK